MVLLLELNLIALNSNFCPVSTSIGIGDYHFGYIYLLVYNENLLFVFQFPSY